MTISIYMTDVQGMDKIMETLDSIGIKLFVLAALKVYGHFIQCIQSRVFKVVMAYTDHGKTSAKRNSG
jgi:hypothetical protein